MKLKPRVPGIIVQKQASRTILETDLYRPVHDYLVKQGYTVRSEVHNCDIAAMKGEDVIIVELKRALNISLLAQAVQRQRITDSVYVAIPRPPDKRKWMAQSKAVQAVLRRLEVGLILVSLKRSRPPVEVIFHPVPVQRRKQKHAHRALIQEIASRSADFNQGGSTRRKLVTAYRENAVQIAACFLAERGSLSPRQLRALGTGDKTLSILSRDVYSWFERVSRGVYTITAQGRNELEYYPELVKCFLRALEEHDVESASAEETV